MVDKYWRVKVADFNLARLKTGEELEGSPSSVASSSPGLNPRCALSALHSDVMCRQHVSDFDQSNFDALVPGDQG